MLTFQDYINELKKGKIKTVCKIEWLRNEDESVFDVMTGNIISGSLSINRQNGVRRSCSLKINNINGKYIPSEDSLWVNTKFKLYLGIEINEEDYFISQGVFVLEDPDIFNDLGNTYINISGKDKFSLLNGDLGGSLDGILQIPLNSNIYLVIKDILKNKIKDCKSLIFSSNFMNEVTPYTIIKEYGNGTYGDVMIELAKMLSANIYYNELGNLVFEKNRDIKKEGSIWDFNDNEFYYLGADNKMEFSKIYNKIVVIGANVNGDIATGVAINNNLQSNTRVQLIGEKMKAPIIDDNIYNDDLAQQRAEYELQKSIILQSSVKIKCVPFYHFNVDEIITLTDEKLKLNMERFLIQSLDLQFGDNNSMTLSCVKTKELDY